MREFKSNNKISHHERVSGPRLMYACFETSFGERMWGPVRPTGRKAKVGAG